MKSLSIVFLCFGLFPIPSVAEDPSWTFDAGYALGYADYSESGKLFDVRSEWSGWNSMINLKAQTQVGSIHPYFRVRLMNTEEVVEEWSNQQGVFQYNDMHFMGGDFSMGFNTGSFMMGLWSFDPQLGLIARYQKFERSSFINNSDQLGLADRVSEFVQTYGAGGGIALLRPINAQWEFTMEAGVYGLFFSKVYNDGFSGDIQGDNGIFWDSSIGFSRFVKNPGHRVMLRMIGTMQWIEGGRSGTEENRNLVEWPENRLGNVSLEVVWKSLF